MKTTKENIVIKKLFKLKNPIKAKILAGFFKTGKGEYGEGDIFWGITVPEQRRVAKEFVNGDEGDVLQDTKKQNIKDVFDDLIKSPVHECRLTGLLILTYEFAKAKTEKEKKWIFDLYMKNLKHINNWDLVDVTSSQIVGGYLLNKDTKTKDVLIKLAKSKVLWEKRIALISTFCFIRHNDFDYTLKICEMFLNDTHDLIHKATGWMLREVGKRDEKIMRKFLETHKGKIPRTALRYAIERLDSKSREYYMKLCK